MSALRFVSVTFVLGVAACDGSQEAPPPAAPTAPLVVGSSPPPPPAGSSASGSTFADRLAKARALRDAALAQTPPAYVGDGSKVSRLQFVETKVTDWYEAARGATDTATTAYREAYDAAPASPDRAIAASEAADLQTTFCKRFMTASEQGAPSEWKAQPNLYETFHDTLLVALSPNVSNASLTVDKCLADPTIDTPATRRCTALRGELASLTPKPAAPKPPKPPKKSACICPPADPLCTCVPP